ncbi:hypothetical protein RRG08_042186 [Elysia crispata]|uniref:Parvovirus non-structural protein 1 helicase domain-containing protein n=1 Tax=Elysia crispata TaxID=231223 RepID=A0AAE1CZ01_9GAST|nr:hypothetical protein RRG08_042186 [Elysia crispata]
MEATKPNPKFLSLVEPPSVQELQDLTYGIFPRQTKCVDIMVKLSAQHPKSFHWIASNLDNPAPWAYCKLDYTPEKGFRWVDTVRRMSDRDYNIAPLFLHKSPKPTRRAKSQDADILRRLDELPDSLRHMMTPEQTLALFNAWCSEQDINAKAFAWIMIACLQGRMYKKIGVYLQGASNSGKTYWSSTLFQPLSKLVGKMTTGGRFCLQDCVNKRIIVGEEVGIAADNVDRLKELMSGEKTTFERKMQSPGTCKANLVILNSNNIPFANVPQEKQALENRMFIFKNLKKSKILPVALKNMEATKPNPKFMSLIEPPTPQELQDLMNGIYPRQSKCVDNMGLVPDFTGDWEAWSDELTENRRILESDMAAPEFIVDMCGTLAASPPSPELFTPSSPEQPYNIRVEITWPFQAQPQAGEDLRDISDTFSPHCLTTSYLKRHRRTT